MGANGQAQSQVASATHIGGKTFQQDEYLVQSGFLTLNDQPIHLYAVFDGHGTISILYIDFQALTDKRLQKLLKLNFQRFFIGRC